MPWLADGLVVCPHTALFVIGSHLARARVRVVLACVRNEQWCKQPTNGRSYHVDAARGVQIAQTTRCRSCSHCGQRYCAAGELCRSSILSCVVIGCVGGVA
jgi:hypothetical protein